MPFSELGDLSGVPNQPQLDPASLPSVSQLKAKSALGAFAAQRVAGLAQSALHLVENALAAGRRGEPSLHSDVALCSCSVCACMHACAVGARFALRNSTESQMHTCSLLIAIISQGLQNER